MSDSMLQELLNVVERKTRKTSKAGAPKASKTKRVQKKNEALDAPLPAPESSDESSRDTEDVISRDVSEKPKKRGRPKKAGRKKSKSKEVGKSKNSPVSPEQEALIRKINEIYAANGYERISPLHIYDVAALRNHLNLLQWGLIPWMTPLGKLPDPPDEFPPNGFKCTKGMTTKWTNSYFCQLRTLKPELYWECKDCKDFMKSEDS